MHDLVHDLALDVSEGSCLTLEASEVKHHPEVQHLSLCLNKETRLEFSDRTVGKLRSLFSTGNLPQNTEDVKSIRALSIVDSDGKELSSSICKFIHLKYLDLSKSSFEKVPNSITKLYNLETLRLPPNANLEEIQKEFHKLVNLRHIEISRKMIPTKIGHLSSLQTLPFFFVGEDEGHRIEELGSLSKLRGRLHVYDLRNVKDKEEAERAKMSEKSKVRELEFHWDRNPGMSDVNYGGVLEGLKPHKDLRGLILRDFGGRRFSSWMRSRDDQSLQNLVKIELIGCKSCEDIPILGHLPKLEVVVMENLDNVESIGPEFYGLDERIVGGGSSTVAVPTPAVFPALKKLTIRGMRKLKEWSDVSSLPPATTRIMKFFPQLEKLHIEECPNLITIPGHLLCIQNLAIRGEWYSFDFEKIANGLTSTIVVDPDSTNVSTLIEHLLETSRKSLKCLKICGLEELCYLPKQLLNLASLEVLEIITCRKLMYIGEETGGEFNSCLTSLQELSIIECNELRCLPKGLLQPTIVRLKILLCPNLMYIGEETGGEFNSCLTSLQELFIIGCNELRCLPKGLLQPTLVRLQIRYCPKLMYIGEETGGEFNSCLASLQELEIKECCELRCLPKGLLQPTIVRLNIIGCSNLTEAGPDELRNLTSLQDLELDECNSRWARPWKEGQFCLTSLRTLAIGNFSEELDYFPWPEVEMVKTQNPQHYPFMFLESLKLWGWPKLKCLPDQLRHLTSIRELEINEFEGLEALPEWLGNFSSLESLELYKCPNLRSLPSLENFQLLKNLQSLDISECPLLAERCEEGGEEWHKIAHIPTLDIDDRPGRATIGSAFLL